MQPHNIVLIMTLYLFVLLILYLSEMNIIRQKYNAKDVLYQLSGDIEGSGLVSCII